MYKKLAFSRLKQSWLVLLCQGKEAPDASLDVMGLRKGMGKEVKGWLIYS